MDALRWMFATAVGLVWPATCLHTNLLHFLQDALTHFQPHSAVVAFLCWQPRESAELMKALSQSGLMMSVQSCSGVIPAPGHLQAVTFLLDLHSQHATRVLEKADAMDLFSSPHRWLVVNTAAARSKEEGLVSLEELRSMLSSMSVFVDSQVVLAYESGGGSFLLAEIYRMGPDQDAVVRSTGRWHSREGLQLTELSLPVRRTNLHRTRLKASMVITDNDTLGHLTDFHNSRVDTITKVNYVLLALVADIMNASIDFLIVDSWGYRTNTSWSGTVGHLQRKEAVVGATPMFFTSVRLPIIDFIALTTPTRVDFVFRPPPLSFVTNVFTLPFSRSVWLSSAGLVLVCGVALYCAIAWEASQHQSSTGVAVWSDVALLSLGAVCQQGYHVEMKATSGRIVAIFLFVAVLFLYTSYSGCIVALLQSSTDSIRTLEDLLNSRLEVGAHDIVYNRYYFETASDPVRKGLSRRLFNSGSKKPNFLELEEGVEKIRRGLFAFHMEASNGYDIVQDTFTEEEKCGLQSLGGFIQPRTDAWIAVQKDTPYKEILKRGYRKVQEHGLQSRELSRRYTRKPQCSGHTSSFVSVGLVDWYPVLVVLITGALASVLVLLLEVAVHRRMHCRASREPAAPRRTPSNTSASQLARNNI